ncbi:MAG TPA: RNA methyltransferase [Azoarcus sp.]|nr:RNA methyltransferase [Azoarcus sp.]
MSDPGILDRVRVILVRTSHPGNIGATARAMKTMGMSRLVLVDPAAFPDPVADARASGALDVLHAARIVPTLEAALEGTVMSAALTARRRELSVAPVQPRELAPALLQQARAGEVALVFGTESSGLTNHEVALCTQPVTIATNPDYSSLNLASAVQLLCYEARLAALDPKLPEAAADLARHEEIEGFHNHLEAVMRAAEFYDPATSRRLLPRIRRMFGRIRLEREEINILRGLLAALQRKLD